MRPILAVLVLAAVAMGGCDTWRTAASASLTTAHEGIKGTSKVGEAHFMSKCTAAAKACGSSACPAADKCLAELREFTKLIIAARAAIHTGIVSAMVGDEADTKAILLRLARLALELDEVLRKGGVYGSSR